MAVVGQPNGPSWYELDHDTLWLKTYLDLIRQRIVSRSLAREKRRRVIHDVSLSAGVGIHFGEMIAPLRTLDFALEKIVT